MAQPSSKLRFVLVIALAACCHAPARGEPAVGPPSNRRSSAPTTAAASLAASPAASPPVQRTGPTSEALPLGVPARSADRNAGDPGAVRAGQSLAWWLRTALALTLVIGLIVASKVVVQRVARSGGGLAGALGAGGRAPSGVLEVLGRYPVTRAHRLVLLRVDRRVVLLGHSPTGFTTLLELNDPDDVASILTKTRDEEGASLSARFSEVLRGLERDPALVAEHEPAGMQCAHVAPAAEPARHVERHADASEQIESLRARIAQARGAGAPGFGAGRVGA